MLFRLENIQKYYGRLAALKGITLEMDDDAIGLLGPNGAGKSTLIKVLLGLQPLDGGHAELLGMRVPDEAREIRRATGYMPESDCYLPYMTAIEYVAFNGQLCGMPRSAAFRRAHEVLYFVGLEEARYRKLDGFSTGMKQRAKLAQAIVHGPRVLFLDEPTNGLDPQGRDDMLGLIEDVRARDVHIILSTHLLPDVERICDSVIMLNQGELVHSGSLTELQDRDEEFLEVRTHLADQKLQNCLRKRGFDAEIVDDRLKIRITPDHTADEVLAIAVDEKIQIRHFLPERLTLETAFLRLLDEADDTTVGP